MSYQIGLPEALARRGVWVEVVPGWQSRGSSTFDPRGAVSHWTAGPKAGDRPSLKVCTVGRLDLPGPLCNVFLTRAGTAVVVAAGRANHAGKGGWKGLSGNSTVFGTEAESSGDGDWTDAQRKAYPRVNAAYCDLVGFGPDMLCGHHEWAPDRKIDIRDWPMPAMRASVAAILEDDMPSADEVAQAVLDKLHSSNFRRYVWEHPIRTDREGRVASAEVVLAGLDALTLRAIVDGLLDTTIDRSGQGRGPTTLRAILAWSDTNTDKVLAGVAAAVAASSSSGVEAAVREAVRSAVSENYQAILVPKKES